MRIYNPYSTMRSNWSTSRLVTFEKRFIWREDETEDENLSWKEHINIPEDKDLDWK